MRKLIWLEFENDERLNAFMTLITGFPWKHDSVTGFSRIGSKFPKDQIEIAKRDFGAKVIEKPD